MKWLKYVMLLAAVSLAAITKITLPTDFNTVANGTRANLSGNFSEIDTRSDAAFDSVDEVRGRLSGYTGDFTITSLDHLRLRLDSDGSILGRFFISNGSTGDSLWRISEDSTWRAFGAGTGTKLTLSDSILAATMRISGLTASRLMATNAGSTAASVADLTTWVAGTANQITSTSDGDGSITLSIPNGFTLPSASPTFTNLTLSGTLGVTGASALAALSATTGTFSSTISVTGASTLAAMSATTGSFSSTLAASGQSTLAGITVNGGASGQGRLYTTSTVGLALQSLAGSSYDFSILGTSGIGSYVMRVPTGTTTAVFPNAMEMSFLSSGRIPYAGSGGAIGQDNLYWDATNDRLGIGVGAATPAYTLDVLKSTTGSAVIARLGNSESTDPASSARLEISTAGASAGDPFVLFNNNVVNWSIGSDNSDGDALVITPSTTPGGATNGLRISTAGAITIPGTLGVTGAITGSISGNAATVTTNANLTGPITSTGNATAIASQTGTGTTFMMSASPTTTGTLTAAAITASGAVSTGALTATTATLGGGEAFVYGDTSFTLTATGMTTSPTGTAYGVKVGNAITLTIPYITGTSNSTGFTLTGLPAGWRPTRAVMMPYSGYVDNGVANPLGFIILTTGGTLTLGTSTSTAGWTNSGTKAIGQSILPMDVSISYQIK